MLSSETFIVSDVDDAEDILKAWQTSKILDPIDFSIDATNYPVINKALFKGKFKLDI